MEKIIEQAIREVTGATDAEKFAQMNETAYKIAAKAYELAYLERHKEQPEVDLGEITPSLIDNILCDFGVQSIDDMDSKNLAEFARYFYELGLKARK